MPFHIRSHSFFLCALDFQCVLPFSFRFHMTTHLRFISPFLSLSERILLPIFCSKKGKAKRWLHFICSQRCEIFQTENKTQSKTSLHFLFLVYIICICSLNYIRQTQKSRSLTLGETNIIFYWCFKLYFTETMITESLFAVFPNSNHTDSFSINDIIPFIILQSKITLLFVLLSQCELCINGYLFSCKEEIERIKSQLRE